MSHPFLDALRERVLIGDGAMGTQLYAQGVFLNRAFEELTLTQPELVLGVHNSYVRAGADVIETNTFGANRLKLATFGLADRVGQLNAAAARLARHAARDAAFVAGSIGPLGVRVEPWGKLGLDEAEGLFREQAEALADGGVDLFILETFRDVSELGAAIRGVRAASNQPVVAMLTTGEDGASLDGMPAEQFAHRLLEFGPDVIGVNCSVGPAPMLDAIERIAAAVPDALLAALPNAGKPRDVDGRNLYLCSPDYMASYARRFAQAGVRLIGGCCGTTPEHVRQIRQAVRALASTPLPGASRGVVAPTVTRVTQPPVPRIEKSRLSHALAHGRGVVGIELEAPAGHSMDAFVARARHARIRGADFVLVSAAPGGRAHTSALAAAVTLEQKAGVETVLQYCCRDHSLHAMQADLLGAHALGLRNLLLVTGRPQRLTEYPDATAVYDVDSIGLTNVVARFNVGEDVGAQSIGAPTAFHVGAAANPTAVIPDRELSRYRYKVEAGAEFVVMGPIYDVDALRAFLDSMGESRVPVLAIVRPFESAREAERLAHEEPGIGVPSSLVERMVDADARGEASVEARRIADELVAAVRPLVEGVILASSGSDPDTAIELLSTTFDTGHVRA